VGHYVLHPLNPDKNMIFQKEFQAEEQPSSALVSCFCYQSASTGYYPLHCHSYYEISYVIKGERYAIFDGIRYPVRENSMLFVPPLTVHGNENITDVEDIVIQFSPDFLTNNSCSVMSGMVLESGGGELPYMVLDTQDSGYLALNKLIGFCKKYPPPFLDSDNNSKIALELSRSSLILELLSLLIQTNKLIIKQGYGNSLKINLLDNVINHILSNPEEKLDMETAARIAGMSYYSFSRFFKKVIGISYSNYCNLLRIRYAEDLLIKTELPISEIARSIGIEVPSYFTKLFKQINGNPPAEYRELYKKN
jgi:AraC-like DNA-binding protein/quercetin dioxygenase-like cupin family protein